MSRKILIAAVSMFALGVVVSPAAAQMSKPIGLAIRAGVVFPTDSGTRNSVGNTLFGAGVQFKVADANMMGMGGPGNTSHIDISGDWFGKNGGSEIPVLLNWVGMSDQFFYSVGAGVTFITGNGNNLTKFGYQAGIGYQFMQSQMPIFLEAKYWGTSDSKFNAVGVYLGVRL